MLLRPVRHSIAEANKGAGRAISDFEAKALLRPAPFNPRPNASAGQLLVEAAKAFDGDPFARLKSDRTSLRHAIRKHRSPILRALKDASNLAALADIIEEGGNVPPTFSEPFASQARIAIAGAKAGIVDNHELARSMRRAAADAEETLNAALKDFRRFESAAAIATSKIASSFLKSYGGRYDRYAAHYSDKAEKMTAIHRKAFPPAKVKKRRTPPKRVSAAGVM